MRLDQSSWLEIEAYLQSNTGIILPVGSTEQHGPMGLIGTDTICAESIAFEAALLAKACVAPSLAYTPAPFNTAFPGTISVSPDVFEETVFQIMSGLVAQGFRHIYVLNGHGANLDPLESATKRLPSGDVLIKSWWDFEPVNTLRREYYGDWEGMHATPSEVSITQATHRRLPAGAAAEPPRKLSLEYIKAHSRDRHGPPDEHRAEFPDGRVGSHSALASPVHGRQLIAAAAKSVAEDYQDFCGSPET